MKNTKLPMKPSNNPITLLLNDLGIMNEPCLMVYESKNLHLEDVKYIYDKLVSASKTGTIAIFGDSSFNQFVTTKKGYRRLSNQQRYVLASGKLLQLLALEDDVHYATHPAISMGTKGKYARFLARPLTLDFPYGSDSIFKDLYELNAIVVFVGDDIDTLDCLRYFDSKLEDPIIIKNTSSINGEIVTYLDTMPQKHKPFVMLNQENKLSSITIGQTNIKAVRFQDLIALL